MIVKITFVDKTQLAHYDKFKTFCTLSLQSNKGDFTFIFKEDRRSKVRENAIPQAMPCSYFVELVSPDELDNSYNIFKDKIAVVIKIKLTKVNYEALASVLLDLYIDTFSSE